MPNVKIYVDETLMPDCRAGLAAALNPLRAMLCEVLKVDVAACQFAVLPVLGMPDQPPVNVEIHILQHPGRSRDMLTALALRVQAQVGAVTGTYTAVRIATLVPDHHVALKQPPIFQER